jgi:hypothetical protein
MFKDFLKNELAIGDTVVLIAPNYRHLVKAKIIAFTAKNVRVEFNNTWNHGPKGDIQQVLQSPDQLVKIPGKENALSSM